MIKVKGDDISPHLTGERCSRGRVSGRPSVVSRVATVYPCTILGSMATSGATNAITVTSATITGAATTDTIASSASSASIASSERCRLLAMAGPERQLQLSQKTSQLLHQLYRVKVG